MLAQPSVANLAADTKQQEGKQQQNVHDRGQGRSKEKMNRTTKNVLSC
jgi:hypothetical protein